MGNLRRINEAGSGFSRSFLSPRYLEISLFNSIESRIVIKTNETRWLRASVNSTGFADGTEGVLRNGILQLKGVSAVIVVRFCLSHTLLLKIVFWVGLLLEVPPTAASSRIHSHHIEST